MSSFYNYLDDEYFQLQDFLSTLIDTLPTVNPKSDDRALVKTIIEQNKSYGKKVVSLYQKLNNFYTNSLNTTEKSEKGPSNDFVNQLKDKIYDYEQQIQSLQLENQNFIKQIKQLSLNQNEPFNARDLAASPFFAQGNQNLPTLGKEVSPPHHMGNTKSVNESFNIPSPIPRHSNVSRISKDVSFDLDHMFLNAEYNKAMDLLSQHDYHMPSNVPIEKFCKWLTIANRKKDSQIADIYSKLKSIVGNNDWQEQEKGIDESMDRQPVSLVDKIFAILDEKLPKSILQSEYTMDRRRSPRMRSPTTQDEYSDYPTAYFKEGDEDRQMNEAQLRQKVRYLKETLTKSEANLQNRESEVKLLRQKIAEAIGNDQQRPLSARGTPNKERVRFEDDLGRDANYYKAKFDDCLHELETYKKRLYDAKQEIDLLKREGRQTRTPKTNRGEERVTLSYSKEQTGGISVFNDFDVSDFMVKDHHRTPTVSQIEPTGEYQEFRGNLKGNLLIEYALQNQKNNLYNTKQIVGEFQALIFDKFKLINMQPQSVAPLDIEPELGSPENLSEAQKILKSNTNTIKSVNHELKDLKKDVMTLINKLSNTRARQSPRQSLDLDVALREKVVSAEEVLMQNLSQTLQSLSRLTASLHELGAESKDKGDTFKMASVFDLIQIIHSQLEHTIQDYPEFKFNIKNPQNEDFYRAEQTGVSDTLRKRFAVDRHELTHKLRDTLQKFEAGLVNDALNKLSTEIEKNQHLQDVLESKRMLIHRLSLIFTDGVDKCEGSIRQLLALADSEDAQSLLSGIIQDVVFLRRSYGDMMAQGRSPIKRAIKIDDENLNMSSHRLPKRRGLSGSWKDEREISESVEVRKKGAIEHRRATETDEPLKRMAERTRERDQEQLQQKVRELELEKEELVANLDRLRQDIDRHIIENEGLKEQVRRAEDECRKLVRETSRDLEIRDREIDTIRGRLEVLDRENRELLDYKAATEKVLKNASEHVGHLKLGYYSDVNVLKEENMRLEAKRQEILAELDKKVEENAKLNQLIDTLQKFSNKQMESLREKEEKLALVSNQKRESELLAKDLERQVELLTGKNKRSIEKAKESVDDVNALRTELKKAVDRYDEIQKDAESLRVWTKELQQEKERLLQEKEILENEKMYLEDRLRKMTEIADITKAELRKAHELLDLKSDEIVKNHKEIQRLREPQSQFQKDDYKEPEYVAILKRELKMRNDELQKVKNENRRAAEINEKLQAEIDAMRLASRTVLPSTRQSTVDLERDIPRRVVRTEAQGSGYKEDYRETKNNSILKSRTASPLQVSRSRDELLYGEKIEVPRGYTDRYDQDRIYMEGRTISFNERGSQLGESNFNNKEKEINRLTQVVKDLTQSLRGSQQDPRRNLHFASPQ